MRRTSTATERLLWRKLRDRRLEGLKFRRQVALGPYIVDFVCLRHRLIVEADGPFHEPEADAVRDAWLHANNFRVLRLSNREIQGAAPEVIDRILEATNPPPPSIEV